MVKKLSTKKRIVIKVEQFLETLSYLNLNQEDKEQICRTFHMLVSERKMSVDELFIFDAFFDSLPSNVVDNFKDSRDLFFYTLHIVILFAIDIKRLKRGYKEFHPDSTFFE